ncbi:hypothetical protein TWF481_006015 [Arthrobotrys musiformis]|uniref:Uncharacterized protein n=1 Tax=Arthrobotrys musiformis TaxID=47236 RepID=A0AAV9WFH1_9PEZI
MPNTTLDGGRGALGPEVCALFNCAVDPSGGPVQGGSDTLNQVEKANFTYCSNVWPVANKPSSRQPGLSAALLDRLLGTNLVRILQGGATSGDANGLVGPLVCLLFSCNIGPQVTTTLTTTSTATSVSTVSTTRLSTTTLTSTCSPTTIPMSIFTTTTSFVTLTSPTTSTVFSVREY